DEGVDDPLDLEQVVVVEDGGMAQGVGLFGGPLLLVVDEGAVEAAVGAGPLDAAVEVVVGVAVGDAVAVGPAGHAAVVVVVEAQGAAGGLDDAGEVAGLVVAVADEDEVALSW